MINMRLASTSKKAWMKAKDNQQNVNSPCVDICALDEEDVCIGCYRHGREVSHWGIYSNEQKLQVLESCKARSQGKNIKALT